MYLFHIPTGLTTISGPTGAGKSTTLCDNIRLLIKECNASRKVITIEDPPELLIEGVIQHTYLAQTLEERQIKTQLAMIAALRSDPDVIIPGETRDSIAAKLLFTATETGHQTFTTVHTTDAHTILDRYRGLDVDPLLLYNPKINVGLVAQRLVRILCPHCSRTKPSAPLHHTVQERIHMLFGNAPLRYVGPGCEHCKKTGYSRRKVIAEIVITDIEYMDYMRQANHKKAIEYWIRERGGRPMIFQAATLVGRGEADITDIEEAVGPLTPQALIMPTLVEEMRQMCQAA